MGYKMITGPIIRDIAAHCKILKKICDKLKKKMNLKKGKVASIQFSCNSIEMTHVVDSRVDILKSS